MSVPDLGGSNPDKQWFSVLVLLLENRFCSLRILAISSPIVLWIVSHGTLCKLLSSRPDASSHRSSLFFPVWPPYCNIWYTYMLGKNKHLYTNLDVLSSPVLPPGPQCTRLHPSLSTLNLLKSSTSYSHGTKRLQFHYKMWAKGGKRRRFPFLSSPNLMYYWGDRLRSVRFIRVWHFKFDFLQAWLPSTFD